MEECKHENTENNTYQQEYYGRWFLTTVKRCVDCGEILYEKTMDMKIYK
jgi:hypothetical protein